MRFWKGFGLTSAVLAAAAFAGLGGASSPARADGGGDLRWFRETTDRGCYRLVADLMEDSTFQGSGFVWTGPCTPGQPITGEGVFYRQYPGGFGVSFTGRIVNGFPDGPTQFTTYDVNGGVMVPSGSPQPMNFRMGCPDGASSDCQPGSPFGVVNVPQLSTPLFGVPGGPSSFSSASATTTAPGPAGQAAADDCISMDGKGAGDHGWRVVNNCSYKAIGSWCYDDDGSFSCAKRKKAGFGPIGPGRSEGVAASPGGAGKYRITWCDYEDYIKGRCAADKPWDGPPS